MEEEIISSVRDLKKNQKNDYKEERRMIEHPHKRNYIKKRLDQLCIDLQTFNISKDDLNCKNRLSIQDSHKNEPLMILDSNSQAQKSISSFNLGKNFKERMKAYPMVEETNGGTERSLEELMA